MIQVTDPSLAYIVLGGFVVAVSYYLSRISRFLYVQSGQAADNSPLRAWVSRTVPDRFDVAERIAAPGCALGW